MESSVFSERLIMLRKKASLSQNRVAEALGVSRQAVGKWESGKSVPSLACYAALAALYDISADELLTGSPFAQKAKAETAEGESFAERLRFWRNLSSLSQGELADALSVSRQSVSKWERGESEPDTDRLIALSALLSAPIALLLPKPLPLSASVTEELPAAPEKEVPCKPSGEEKKANEREAGKEEKAEGKTAPSKSEPSPEEKTTQTQREEEPLAAHRHAAEIAALLHKKEQAARQQAKKEEKKSKEIAFRTIADIEPNDPAYVYVNKNDGKVRTMLPFLASIPICTLTIALIIKKKFGKKGK